MPVVLPRFFNNYLDAYRGLSQPTWMLALVMFINQSGSMVLPFLGVYMTTVLDFSLKNTGLVLSFFGIGAILGSLVGGWLTDKLGSFRIQTFSLFASIPFYCLIPLFDTVSSLCLSILALSFFKELFRPANSASVATYARPENLTRAFSLNRMALNLGYSIGPAIGGFLAALSYDFLFYTNGIVSFLAGILFFFYFKNRKRNSNKEKQSEEMEISQLKKAKSAYLDFRFLLFSLCVAVYAFGFFQILNTLPLFYKTEAMLDEKAVGLLMAFNGFIVFVFEMALVHYAEKKFSLRTNMIFGTFLCGLAFWILIPSSSLFILYFSIFIISISEILVMPFASTIAVQRSVPSNRGSYMGLNGISFSIAHVTAPLIGTMIAEFYGFNTLWVFNGLVILLACAGLYYIMRKI